MYIWSYVIFDYHFISSLKISIENRIGEMKTSCFCFSSYSRFITRLVIENQSAFFPFSFLWSETHRSFIKVYRIKVRFIYKEIRFIFLFNSFNKNNKTIDMMNDNNHKKRSELSKY